MVLEVGSEVKMGEIPSQVLWFRTRSRSRSRWGAASDVGSGRRFGARSLVQPEG